MWLVIAGRGWGKSRTGAEDLAAYGLARPRSRLAVVAPTYADARDTCVEGESGLLSAIPPPLIRDWNRSLGELILTNGTRFKLFSADEPARLRGPQHHRAWGDEFAQWPQDAMDQLLFGLRLGERPQLILTTTPRPIPLVRDLLKRPDVFVTRGSTSDNAANLAPAALAALKARYAGTRLGRQELDGELLDDVPSALFTRERLDEHRRREGEAPDLARVVVAVDPSGGDGPENDEQGIIVCGKGVDGRGYVLADRTCKLSPDGWGRRAVKAYLDFSADRIVYEQNFGGQMVESVIRTAAQAMGVTVATKAVHASRGKAVRAEPIAALDEQGRLSIIGSLPELEDELCTWSVESGQSPNRLDAYVWACTDLFLTKREVKLL